MNVNRFRFLNDTFAYAVGEAVCKYSVTAPPVDVEERMAPSPARLAHAQSYPNPFNPSTRIRYVLDRDDEIVILAIHDLAGKTCK